MSKIIEATDETFKNLIKENSDKHILIDFWAKWCAPCKMLAPVLESIAEEQKEIVIIKLEVDENPNTAKAFGIRSLPTLTLFKGDEELATRVGGATKGALISWIDNNK